MLLRARHDAYCISHGKIIVVRTNLLTKLEKYVCDKNVFIDGGRFKGD